MLPTPDTNTFHLIDAALPLGLELILPIVEDDLSFASVDVLMYGYFTDDQGVSSRQHLVCYYVYPHKCWYAVGFETLPLAQIGYTPLGWWYLPDDPIPLPEWPTAGCAGLTDTIGQ